MEASSLMRHDVTRSPAGSRLGEDREQEILRAVFDLLGEVGYDGLRFDAVAARARASKATLYRHWPTKAQLVGDAVRACGPSECLLPDTGSLRGDLRAMLSCKAQSIAGRDGPLFAGLIMAMHSDPEFAAEMRAMIPSLRPITEVICDRAVQRGELGPDCDPDLIEEIGPAQLFMQSFARGRPLDDDFITHLVDDILIPLLTR